jgi:uncharacterized membrane protein YesL
MALFKRNFDKPGPGVPKNAPRKKGFARFLELLGRDISNLVKLNLIYQICLLPAQLMLVAGVICTGTPMFLVFALLGLVACIPLGPAKTSMHYIVTKMLRDDPGFVWHDFKRLFRENFKSSLIPGLAYGAVVGAQVFAVVMYLHTPDPGIVMAALFIFSVLVFNMAAPYYFVQAGYLDLKAGALLKNSMLLALGFVPRSLMGALLGSGLVLAQVLLFPYTVPLLLVAGYTVPCLISMMWVWPPLDKTFTIEKTLKKRDSGKYGGSMPDGDDANEDAIENALPHHPLEEE